MEPVYHLVAPEAWERDPSQAYCADSLATEGFIHCSYARQVAPAANRFYASAPELLVLTIDTTRLASPLREEPAATGELFPHIHGPLNRDAVRAAVPLKRDGNNRWFFQP
jgi:uncharacterized protein (DUF952 family)